MAHELTFRGKVAVIRWLSRPEVAELDESADRLEAWAGTEAAQRALLVIITPTMILPEAAGRERLQARIGKLLPRLGWAGMVIEGQGLMVETKRLFVRAVSTLAKVKLHQFASEAEALGALPPGLAESAAATPRAAGP
jgi:hypothetical protein